MIPTSRIKKYPVIVPTFNRVLLLAPHTQIIKMELQTRVTLAQMSKVPGKTKIISPTLRF